MRLFSILSVLSLLCLSTMFPKGEAAPQVDSDDEDFHSAEEGVAEEGVAEEGVADAGGAAAGDAAAGVAAEGVAAGVIAADPLSWPAVVGFAAGVVTFHEIYDIYKGWVGEGCWPRNIDGEDQVFNQGFTRDKEGFNDASKAISETLSKSPNNTLCEKTTEESQYMIKCVKGEYAGITCGTGTHKTIWDPEYYKHDQISSDLQAMLQQQEDSGQRFAKE